MNQTKLSLGQAAKQVGVSKPTLSRWIKNGRISGQKQEDGSYLIDASELSRMEDLKNKGNARSSNDNPEMKQSETPIETRMLQREIEMLEERLGDKDETIRDLRENRDIERREKERLLGVVENQTRLLTATREPKQSSWWPFGRKAS